MDALFFALFEAQQFGSPTIETEHLLLGLVQADPGLANRIFTPEQLTKLRPAVQAHTFVGEPNHGHGARREGLHGDAGVAGIK
jgi:hypothetical protein